MEKAEGPDWMWGRQWTSVTEVQGQLSQGMMVAWTQVQLEDRDMLENAKCAVKERMHVVTGKQASVLTSSHLRGQPWGKRQRKGGENPVGCSCVHTDVLR